MSVRKSNSNYGVGREKFKIETYLSIINKLHAVLFFHMKAYIYYIFGFLTKFPLKTDAEIKEAAQQFRDNYPEDIELEFIDKMVQFMYFILHLDKFKANEKVPVLLSHKLIFESIVESTFPNVMTTLKIYRCLIATNATGKRSFLKLKLLKYCHQSLMTQERLNSLTIMTIENDTLQKTDFKDILKEFTAKKLVRVNI